MPGLTRGVCASHPPGHEEPGAKRSSQTAYPMHAMRVGVTHVVVRARAIAQTAMRDLRQHGKRCR